jgi:hypothetical protein
VNGRPERTEEAAPRERDREHMPRIEQPRNLWILQETNAAGVLLLWNVHRGAQPANGFEVNVPEKTGRTVANRAAALVAEDFLNIGSRGAVTGVQDAVDPFVAMVAIIRLPVRPSRLRHS